MAKTKNHCPKDGLPLQAKGAMLCCPLCDYKMPASRLERLRYWAQGKAWWWRWPFLAIPGAIFYQLLTRPLKEVSLAPLLDGLNFGMHELGHLLAQPFGALGEPVGRFIVVFAGTGLQCFVPLLLVFALARKRFHFAALISLSWLPLNLFHSSIYASDARAMELPLISLMGETGTGRELGGHDWNYMLSQLGLLQHDQLISKAMVVLGVMTLGLSLLGALWLLVRMARKPQ